MLLLLASAAVLVRLGGEAWWLLPVGVPAALWISLLRARRGASHDGCVAVTSRDDDEWLRPIDLMVDSNAPEQIAFELGRRHALYLREAQRLVLDGLVPDEPGLADGIRGETHRYLRSHPWLAHAALEPAVAETEGTALAALQSIVASARSNAPAATPAARPPRPVRRLALQPSATIVGNMTLRKKPTAARCRALLGHRRQRDRVEDPGQRPTRPAPGLRRRRDRHATGGSHRRSRSGSTSTHAGSSSTVTPATGASYGAPSSPR